MPPAPHIHVSLADQSLQLREGDAPARHYPISTALRGPGTEENSYQTPLGRFRICEKFGDHAPPYTIFRGRLPVGLWSPTQPSPEDLVLTRILRLDGLDPENENTYQRYIYIHGTNQEELLGTPASHGCIRMRNADVLDLYARTPLDTPVTISLHSP